MAEFNSPRKSVIEYKISWAIYSGYVRTCGIGRNQGRGIIKSLDTRITTQTRCHVLSFNPTTLKRIPYNMSIYETQINSMLGDKITNKFTKIVKIYVCDKTQTL